MNCSVAQQMFGAYLDGELDASSELQLRLHLSECAFCVAGVERLRMRGSMIRRGGLRYGTPAELEQRIRKSIGTKHRRWSNWQSWGAAAAAILLASGLSIQVAQHSAAENRVAQEVISSHVRAMMTGHTTDVASTDRHTVKPWFSGRIDFSPPVSNWVTRGFPLIGGRLDYLDGRAVAALVYQRRGHLIDLFIWPARSVDVAARDHSWNGFNVIRWTAGGMSFAAVSDLNETELGQFRSLVKGS